MVKKGQYQESSYKINKSMDLTLAPNISHHQSQSNSFTATPIQVRIMVPKEKKLTINSQNMHLPSVVDIKKIIVIFQQIY